MPSLPPKACGQSGCRTLALDGSGYCPTHKKASKPTGFSKQLSRHQRGYGALWDKLRLGILRRDGGLCQVCVQAGLIRFGNIVDHITPKAEGGDDDPANLQTICKQCHTVKTAMESARGGQGVAYEPAWLPAAAVPVVTVVGPPGSGKSTYVNDQAAHGDLVLDVDAIAAEMFRLPLYHATREQRMAALRYRNKMLAGLAAANCGYNKAWLIVTAGSPEKRMFWQKLYGKEMVVLRVDKVECVRRVKADERRTTKSKLLAIQAIYAWY